MSIWCSFKGNISISKSSNISLKKAIEDFFIDDDYRKPIIESVICNENFHEYNITMEFVGGSVAAVAHVQEFIILLKKLDKRTRVDVSVTTRICV